MAKAADEIFDDDTFACLYDHFNLWSAGDDFVLGCGTGMLAVLPTARRPRP